MAYVSKDELCDTIDENLRPINNALDKMQDQVDRDLEALELRIERSLAQHRAVVVPFPAAANAVKPKEFAQLQDDFDTLQEIVVGLLKVAKQQAVKITALTESVELLSYDSDND